MPRRRSDQNGADDAKTSSTNGGGKREAEAEIPRAAVSLFFEHGYAAVGIRQIAGAVPVGISTLYHYYGSKLGVLEAVMESSNLVYQEKAEHAIARSSDPRLRFAHLVAATTALQIASPKTTYVIDIEVRALDKTSERGRRILDQRRLYEGIWRDVIAEGAANGDFNLGNQDVARVSLMGMYSQISLWYRPNAVIDIEELCLELVDIGLGGLRAPSLTRKERKAVIEGADFLSLPWEPDPGPAVSEGFPNFVGVLAD